MKSAFIRALLILCAPFVLGISFEQAALRADYELAWSPQRPSALPFWPNQLSGAARGFFPADYYPAFPVLIGYIAGLAVIGIAVSYSLAVALHTRFPALGPFMLCLSSLTLILAAALHFGRVATMHHLFHG